MKTIILGVCVLLSLVFCFDVFASDIRTIQEAGDEACRARDEVLNWEAKVANLREKILAKDRQIKKLKAEKESEEQVKKNQGLEKQRQKEYEEAVAVVSEYKDTPEKLSSWVFGNKENRFNCAVLFATGEAFLIKNNKHEAKKAYEQLLLNFPNSQYAAIVSKRLEITKSNRDLNINIVYPPVIAEADSIEVRDITQEIPVRKKERSVNDIVANEKETTTVMVRKTERLKKEAELLEKELEKRNKELETLIKEKPAKLGEIRLKNGTIIKGKILRSEGDFLIILREDGSEFPMHKMGIKFINGYPVEGLEGFDTLSGE